jgi:hypothetical protein
VQSSTYSPTTIYYDRQRCLVQRSSHIHARPKGWFSRRQSWHPWLGILKNPSYAIFPSSQNVWQSLNDKHNRGGRRLAHVVHSGFSGTRVSRARASMRKRYPDRTGDRTILQEVLNVRVRCMMRMGDVSM